jgi:hypothetical protein
VFVCVRERVSDVGTLHWAKGNVVRHNYEEPKGKFHPYQVRLTGGRLIFAPGDDDFSVRSVASAPVTEQELGFLQLVGHCHDVNDSSGVSQQLAEMRGVAKKIKDAWPELAFEIFDVLRSHGLSMD